jgi:phage terminase large subunit-like protein
VTKTRAKRSKKTKLEPPDPVTAYAIRVLVTVRDLLHDDGWRPTFEAALERYQQTLGKPEPLLAGRAVRLACERHFHDLARQRTIAFPYSFDVDAAQHVITFFPRFLTLESGDPFHLPPWLQFSYGTIFGWKCWAPAGDERSALDPEHLKRVGCRRFKHGFFETSKGSGKTPSAGGIALYGAAYDDEQHAEIYTTGFDKGQAAIILNDAIRMASASGQIDRDDPRLYAVREFEHEFIVEKHAIAHPASGSSIRAMSSQHQSKSGPRPHMVLSDEIHEHRDGTVVTKAEAGFKNRQQPLGLKYTNSGSSKTSYCWQLHQKSIDVLEGTLVDEQWFAYICQLDPCVACHAEGYRQPKDGCKKCDDWTSPKVWPKIAPALGIVIQPKYLQDAVDAALSMPSEFALKRRLNFCIWTETHQIWIPPDHWDACRVPAVSQNNAEGRPCAAGLDLADKNDLAGLTIAVRFDDPPTDEQPEVATVEGMNDEGEAVTFEFTLNFSIELIPFAWIPKQTLLERVKNERIPYDVWERDKKIFPTPGAVIDHQAIYEFIANDVWKRFKIQRLGYDERSATMLAVTLRDKARLGDAIVAVPQGKKLSEACKLISQVLVPARRLRHDGHPVQAWCFANAEPKRDRLRAMWIEKPEEKKRIDLAQSAIMAIHELMLLPAKRQRDRGRGARVWTPGGFVPIGESPSGGAHP